MLILFLLGLALAASPGPDFLLMTKHTLSHGTRMGYATFLGNRTSFILHLTLAVLGLSVILKESALLYLLIRMAGASYLIYLGHHNLFRRISPAHESSSITNIALSHLLAYQRGFWSNLLNPKVSLFFLSIFPQFVTAQQLASDPFGSALVFLSGNSCWYLAILPVVGMQHIRQQVARFQSLLDILFGVLFIGYGGKIALEDLQLVIGYLH
ncbi:Threonine/homoserine/homoserine lactone efflux protein [Fictibacillus solisalsi]|uniref:Threonine/homoserine/homoserine lactone efflux protein n=1 Tax=Fictibacillus solisalsi TaxID=459525 RepID=A0A1G9XMD4_9BACL|nr:LysE family translocator [Fictibacillus solisalsi]SDM97365.1 Threonine/homoserine/homoserine lactone efflux protein [Fictibacillus solisalsi]